MKPVVVSPGGFEQYFRDLRDALGDGPATIGAITARYDVENA